MKRLFRSKSEAKIAGICAGIGDMLDVDPTIIRLTVIFAALMTVITPFVIAYLVGWILIPESAGRNDHVKDPA